MDENENRCVSCGKNVEPGDHAFLGGRQKWYMCHPCHDSHVRITNELAHDYMRDFVAVIKQLLISPESPATRAAAFERLDWHTGLPVSYWVHLPSEK